MCKAFDQHISLAYLERTSEFQFYCTRSLLNATIKCDKAQGSVDQICFVDITLT